MKHAREVLDVLGTPGIVALGILIACATFYVSAVRPVELELRARETAAERLRTRSALRAVASADPASELRRFYSLFPALSQLPDELERLYGLARHAKLDLTQGEYRMEPRLGGLVPYRVTLPMRGTYGQIRGLLSDVLQSMPVASIDSLRFERKKVAEARLEAQLRLTIYFRSGTESDDAQPGTSSP